MPIDSGWLRFELEMDDSEMSPNEVSVSAEKTVALGTAGVRLCSKGVALEVWLWEEVLSRGWLFAFNG